MCNGCMWSHISRCILHLCVCVCNQHDELKRDWEKKRGEGVERMSERQNWCVIAHFEVYLIWTQPTRWGWEVWEGGSLIRRNVRRLRRRQDENEGDRTRRRGKEWKGGREKDEKRGREREDENSERGWEGGREDSSKLVELFTSAMHSGSASVAFNLPSLNALFVPGDSLQQSLTEGLLNKTSFFSTPAWLVAMDLVWIGALWEITRWIEEQGIIQISFRDFYILPQRPKVVRFRCW